QCISGVAAQIGRAPMRTQGKRGQTESVEPIVLQALLRGARGQYKYGRHSVSAHRDGLFDEAAVGRRKSDDETGDRDATKGVIVLLFARRGEPPDPQGVVTGWNRSGLVRRNVRQWHLDRDGWRWEFHEEGLRRRDPQHVWRGIP